MESQTFSYELLSDEELIHLIVTEPHDEVAAYFLLYVRYAKMLKKIYHKFFKQDLNLDRCMNALSNHLEGSEKDYHKLTTYKGPKKFAGWLNKVAWNVFLKVSKKIIIPRPIINTSNTPDIPDVNHESPEDKMRKVLFLEAVNKLRNAEMRIVLIKHMEGYSHEEIAQMIREYWHHNNITKTYKGKVVVPDAEYVDGKKQKAMAKVKEILRGITLGCG